MVRTRLTTGGFAEPVVADTAKSLSKIAFEFASNYLSLNGNFVCKLLGGHYDKTLILEARKKFKFVQLFLSLIHI